MRPHLIHNMGQFMRQEYRDICLIFSFQIRRFTQPAGAVNAGKGFPDKACRSLYPYRANNLASSLENRARLIIS